MNINTNQIVSVSEANQNFSRVARTVDKLGTVIICELLRLIEVGASCFNHYCVDYDIRNHTSYIMSTGV